MLNDPVALPRPSTSFAARSPWIASVALLALAACDGGTGQRGTLALVLEDAAEATAFVDVSVLPLDSERVVEGQTVVVEGENIVWIGPADDVDLGGIGTRIEGDGRYLMPGLAEMHAHVPGDNAPADLTEDILFLYLANGITTMRGMLGAPGQLVLRERLRRGELLGPNFIVGAPSASGGTTPTPDAAEAHIRDAQSAGYDFMKIHPGIPLDAWDRLVEVANEVGMTFAGHVPEDVGIEHALRSGIATVDHLDGYLQGSISDDMMGRVEGDLGVIPTSDLMRAVDPAKVAALVELTRELGTPQVPTMYLWENFYSPLPSESFLERPGMQYVPESMRAGWVRQKDNRPGESDAVAALVAETRLDLLRQLYEAGVPILMGTDAPQMFNVPGFSLHHEIEVMERAMPAYAVLEAGAKNVAKYASESLGLDGNFGTVEVGNRADLILLADNPMLGLGTLSHPEGVMVRGRWTSRAELDAGLARLATKYRN